MAKKKGKARYDLDLIRSEDVDPATGAEIVTIRRGLVYTEEHRYCIGQAPNPRTELENFREAIRDSLEAKGIPSDRTPVWVSVNDELPRPKTEADTPEALSTNGSYWIKNWLTFANEKTEPLTYERACVEYLFAIRQVLKDFDDNQLWQINRYAGAYWLLKSLQGNMNSLADQGIRSSEKAVFSAERARNAKSAQGEHIKGMIGRHAQVLWQKKPSFRDKANATAGAILDSVNAELSEMRKRGESDHEPFTQNALRKRVAKIIAGRTGQTAN